MLKQLKKLFIKSKVENQIKTLNYGSISSNFVEENKIPEIVEHGFYYIVAKTENKATVLLVARKIYEA